MEASVLREVVMGEEKLRDLWIQLLKAGGEAALQQSEVLENLATRYLRFWRLEEIALVTRLVSQGASLERISSYMCEGGVRSKVRVESLHSKIVEDLPGAQAMLKLFDLDTSEPPPKSRKRRRSRAAPAPSPKKSKAPIYAAPTQAKDSAQSANRTGDSSNSEEEGNSSTFEVRSSEVRSSSSDEEKGSSFEETSSSSEEETGSSSRESSSSSEMTDDELLSASSDE